MASLSALELVLFHKLEREFFHRLVRELGQEPEHTRWVMALWLWLESAGHHDLVRRVAALPAPVILRFVAEASECLDRLAGIPHATHDGGDGRLPWTNALLAQPIDLRFLDDHREEAIRGVTSVYKNVCRVVFDDAGDRCPPYDMRAMLLGSARVRTPSGDETTTITSSPRRVIAPSSMLNPMASPWSPSANPLPEDHRSLFITFSRGYPICKDDIIDFFHSRYGPCVEWVMMERAPPGQLPVYGRVVLRSAAMIPVVLNGQQTAKFMIKGRHLWARIYVPSSTP